MALVDIYARHANGGFAWIPKPIDKKGPLLNYDATLEEVYELLTIYPQVWIYDSATKKAINLLNLSEYFPDYDPGGSGSVTPEQLAAALQGKVDKVDGKTLSTNDYTDADKQTLQSMSEKMNKTLTTWKGTQAEYDALESKSEYDMYCIYEDDET